MKYWVILFMIAWRDFKTCWSVLNYRLPARIRMYPEMCVAARVQFFIFIPHNSELDVAVAAQAPGGSQR